ncbi:MAG: M48 family metallopeptidase [Anaerolineae bacterium]|jgi:STE24 endopeptidase|nr:M48 family metallopeptidase [Anaerolineae bacterium]
MPSTFVYAVIVVMFIVDLTISLINYRHRNQPIPAIVEGLYDEEKYHNWLNYTMETLRFRLITKTMSTVLILALLASGFFGLIERWSNQWFSNPVLQTLAFLGMIYLLQFLFSIPFSYYATFVIEEKFGFNKTTLKTFVIDRLKNLLLAAILGSLLVWLLQSLYLAFTDNLWLFLLTAWAALCVIMVVIIFLSKYFVKIFNKLTPLDEESELYQRITSLATQVGFSVSAISEMDASRRSTKLNAFFSGLGKTREVVLYDTLMEKMDDDQIIAVLAHELGHAVHKDVLRMLLQQFIVSGLYLVLIGFVLQSDALAQAFGLSGAHFGFGLILFGLLISPADLLLSIPLNALSRKAEYAADAFAAEHAEPEAIMGALRVLAQENLSNLNPHPLYVKIHYTHPPIAQRLQAIRDGHVSKSSA